MAVEITVLKYPFFNVWNDLFFIVDYHAAISASFMKCLVDEISENYKKKKKINNSEN